ncbi:phosphotransferase family protein [Sphingobium sp. YR768]|uniref:phosphotransferase family protein n=1 Tax=Sphingobium sp. YR768 TaxID=1884365 RepID=UPI0008C6B04C|nr:phosphotransferase family protein [Sphingobium sp. YR768]SER71014.1 Predicted kinase, aminoglycoside phosphotransferase (APT) family [Sphingobium sp. YR768]
MSNAQYLWSAAMGLRTQVRPKVEDSAALGALDNGIRILTAVANALEPAAGQIPAHFSAFPTADTDRQGGPAENAAAYRDTGAAIADAAGRLSTGASLSGLGNAIRWEKTLLDSAIARMDAVERALPPAVEADDQAIDPARLQAYLRRQPGCEEAVLSAFRLIVGGRSRQTAIFSVSSADALPAHMVIQRGIPGQAGSAAFLSEIAQYRLLTQLYAAGMRVPRPVLVEEDAAWLDAPFLLVERVDGAPVQPDYWLPAESEKIVLGLAREMALLHSQPVESVGDGLRQARDRYDIDGWRAELEQLAAQWEGAAHWPSVTMSAVIAWLRENVDCLDDRRAIVHNDMVFHNILADGDQITAVLDWEQAAIGHPGEDLGYCYPVVIAVTDWSRFMDAYRAAGGADIPQRQIDYFALRAGLRLMHLVMHGGRDSFEKGLSDDILVASAGAHFTQRLLHRIAVILASVLERDA